MSLYKQKFISICKSGFFRCLSVGCECLHFFVFQLIVGRGEVGRKGSYEARLVGLVQAVVRQELMAGQARGIVDDVGAAAGRRSAAEHVAAVVEPRFVRVEEEQRHQAARQNKTEKELAGVQHEVSGLRTDVGAVKAVVEGGNANLESMMSRLLK